MKKVLSILNSRTFAVYLLLVMLAMLVMSTFLPNEITRTPDEWALMMQQEPVLFRVANALSTPYLVRQPAFTILPCILFLSTLVCTVTRLHAWWKSRTPEFPLEHAFSFTSEHTYPASLQPVATSVLALLKAGGWEAVTQHTEDGVAVTAQKGLYLGFWGSIAFHVGILLCFLALPISAFTGFSGQMILTEGMALPLREITVTPVKDDLQMLPAVTATVENLRGIYAGGRFKLDFGGDLLLSSQRLPFSVNGPASYGGFQFSLQEFGFAPRIVASRQDRLIFDYYLNLRHAGEGDYFPLGEKGERLFVLFFPDFFQNGGKIGSLSQEPRNPMLLVEVIAGDKIVHQRLVRIGENAMLGEYRIGAPDMRKWVALAVSREYGLPVLVVGMAVGILGLLCRFLSNERRLTYSILASGGATTVELRGFSRYYPAFLQKEVCELAHKLSEKIES